MTAVSTPTAAQPSTELHLIVRHDHRITLEAGAALTARYRAHARPGALVSGCFDRDIFDAILAQEGCAGVRVYNAIHDDGQTTFVLVGSDVHGNDLWHGDIGEEAAPCPPWCGNINPLSAAVRPDELPLPPSYDPATGPAPHLVVHRAHRISLEAAAAMTTRFRRQAEIGTILSGGFDRDIFDAILAQAGCAGIRVYNATHEDGQATFVLVGVNVSGNDLWGGDIGEESQPCPPMCGGWSPLNGD